MCVRLAHPKRITISASLSGNVTRVAEFDTVLSQLEGSANHRLAKGGEGRVRTNEPGKPSKIKMENVDIVTPAGMLGRHESCVQGLSCEITADSSLMVTGANATGASSLTSAWRARVLHEMRLRPGKSSFFRVLGGLWPVHSGAIERPGPVDAQPSVSDIFLVPQRVYMVPGSLADNITYPAVVPSEERDEAMETKLRELLALVGIDYLVDRWAAETKDGESGAHPP